MKLSKLIENLLEVLKENGDQECRFWADSVDNPIPNTEDLIKKTEDKEWVKYLTDHLTDREPLFVVQKIKATKEDGTSETYNFVIL